ncbi:PREDICTED: transcription factor mef2A-like [Rhagoletis zephyria]|uniref:transcription factor mef2A-like n=1 Tax=Rhagoletis zephyria TaxID=28612 RepID=UPI00081158B4|nr:PREDICTED: transcription factor mef2A-like [Rhagoletis zephyria]
MSILFLFPFCFGSLLFLFFFCSLLLFPEQINATTTACMPLNGHLLTAASSIANANISIYSHTNAVLAATNNRPPAAVIGVPPVSTVAVSVNGTSLNTSSGGNNYTNPPIFNHPPIISPTFIEHKYSANTFKEKFLANLRANHTSAHKSNNNINGSSNNKQSSDNCNATTNDSNNNNGNNANAVANEAGTDNLMGNHSSSDSTANATVGIDDLCSIQQQLSENYNKNTIYQKTIN